MVREQKKYCCPRRRGTHCTPRRGVSRVSGLLHGFLSIFIGRDVGSVRLAIALHQQASKCKCTPLAYCIV